MHKSNQVLYDQKDPLRLHFNALHKRVVKTPCPAISKAVSSGLVAERIVRPFERTAFIPSNGLSPIPPEKQLSKITILFLHFDFCIVSSISERRILSVSPYSFGTQIYSTSPFLEPCPENKKEQYHHHLQKEMKFLFQVFF